MHRLPRLFLVLIITLKLLDPSWAIPAQDDPGCLIQGVRYTARVASLTMTGSPGTPLLISIQLDPASLPPGYFVSTNVNLIAAPASPDILPGFPDIKVICPEPGDYILEIVTSLITKSSCAGVSACSLPGQKVTLIIAPPPS